MSAKGRTRQVRRTLRQQIAKGENRLYYQASSEWKLPRGPRRMADDRKAAADVAFATPKTAEQSRAERNKRIGAADETAQG